MRRFWDLLNERERERRQSLLYFGYGVVQHSGSWHATSILIGVGGGVNKTGALGEVTHKHVHTYLLAL
jgi:hypothetical protein